VGQWRSAYEANGASDSREMIPTHLRIGYVPLTDAAPLIVADALGFFAAAGIRVRLSPERAWATLRDKLAFGALDAAHLLGPMAVALALGAGGLRRRLDVTLCLGRNGNAIVISHALAAALDGEVAAAPGDAPHRLAQPLRFGAACPPDPEDASRWFAAMHRSGQLPGGAAEADARAAWRPDLRHAAAATCAALTPPKEPIA
jgi:hypothetical protein